MKLRSTFLTILAFLALIIGGTVQAQDDMAMDIDLCFGLDEADCTVINEASANGLGDAESFTFDVSIDFSGAELSSLFGLVGGFAPDLDLGEIAELNAATFTFDGTFDVVMGEEEGDENVAGSFTTSFSRNDEDVTELAFDIIVTDGLVYLNDGSGWQSIDLERLSENEALSGGMDMLGMGSDDDMQDDMDDEEMDDEDMEATDDLLGGLVGIFGILDLPGFINYERLGDDFVFNIDFAVLQQLLEEENEDLLNELVITASEIDPSFAFFIPLLPTLINDGVISVTQTVDSETNTVTGLDFGTDLVLALGILEGNPNLTTVNLATSFAFSNIDAVTATEAPADAVDATDEAAAWLEGMMGAAEDAMGEMEATEEAGE
ncbi:MAG: hypothetical protein WBC91_08125 [Phototrophicaceae bacterium]